MVYKWSTSCLLQTNLIEELMESERQNEVCKYCTYNVESFNCFLFLVIKADLISADRDYQALKVSIIYVRT